jgi:orotidine-5'-phosphate decarboxylase
LARSPIIVAIDTPEVDVARNLAAKVYGRVAAIKLGLEFFTKNGIDGVRSVTKDGEIPLFLDLKFHDIPNTVVGAVRSAMVMKPAILTVHTLGGKDMLKAAIEASDKNTIIAGVTILTSMDTADLEEICISLTPDKAVNNLAKIAVNSGVGTLVCSSHEITMLKNNFPEVKLIVPGIRPAGSDSGDQKRVMTPKEAVDKGADYLVIGRPITEAQDPSKKLDKILNSL